MLVEDWAAGEEEGMVDWYSVEEALTAALVYMAV